MARGDVFPRRGLGPAEYWGRVIEDHIKDLEGKKAGTSQSIAGVNRAAGAQQGTLADTIKELDRQYELLDDLLAATPSSSSGSARMDGFGLSPGWQVMTSVNLTVPPNQNQLSVTAIGVSKVTDPGSASGNFSWPFPEATITSEYGMRDGRMHYGTDFGIGSGTPIPASNAGTVIANGYDDSRGNYINLSHPGGIETRHYHLVVGSPLGVGTPVAKGQTIGQVGNTGNSFGAHLHWETLVGGTHWNPRDFMAAYGTAIAFTTNRARIVINGVTSPIFFPYKTFAGTSVRNYIYPISGHTFTGSSVTVSYEMFSSETMSYNGENFVNLSVFGVFSP